MLFKGMKDLQQEQIQLNRIKTTIRFIKSGEVVSKMSRRFLFFVQKIKSFVQNFKKDDDVFPRLSGEKNKMSLTSSTAFLFSIKSVQKK